MSVSYRLEGEVAVITLARPERFNSVSADLSRGLIDALARAGAESRAAVLTGAGKAFCAGADLADLMGEYETGGPDLARVIDSRFNPIVRALLEARVPTIAAVNGAAAGAGVGLALACDLRVFSSVAYLLSAFIGLALIPDTGSTWLLVRHLGLSRALELTTTNRRMGAEEAASLGLGPVVAPADLLSRALAIATDLSSGPTGAYPVNRRILYEAAGHDLEAALENERVTQGRLGTQPLHLEGMRAFLEKRTADFRRVSGT
ncbi:MAG TPA: enoyl-CoA hydratase-related protein [Acidimicrobiia bacterium]|nr:enoyl-CoA hydratase-related protein [Acidimicrobiia bacterium]